MRSIFASGVQFCLKGPELYQVSAPMPLLRFSRVTTHNAGRCKKKEREKTGAEVTQRKFQDLRISRLRIKSETRRQRRLDGLTGWNLCKHGNCNRGTSSTSNYCTSTGQNWSRYTFICTEEWTFSFCRSHFQHGSDSSAGDEIRTEFGISFAESDPALLLNLKRDGMMATFHPRTPRLRAYTLRPPCVVELYVLDGLPCPHGFFPDLCQTLGPKSLNLKTVEKKNNNNSV